MPIYLVITPDDEAMVNAPNKSSAINHVIKNTISANVLSPESIIVRMEDGQQVQKATSSKETAVKPMNAEGGNPEIEAIAGEYPDEYAPTEDDLSGSQGFGDPRNAEA